MLYLQKFNVAWLLPLGVVLELSALSIKDYLGLQALKIF